MTSRSTLFAAAAAAVVLGTAGCGTSTKPAASSEAVTTPPSSSSASTTGSSAPTTTAADSSACTDLGGTVGTDNVCKVHTEKPGYTIDMSFPVDYPDQPAVADVLKRQRDQFVTAVEEPPVREVAKALDIKSTTYRSGTPAAGTQSLVFEEYVNIGGAHPETYYEALNYDLGKKAPITFDTLFKPGGNPVAVLDPLVSTALKNQLPGAPVDDNPIGADMYKNFTLTDDAVIFFISQGQWTIEAAGAQMVSIPRSQLASILA
jgi:Protein of unknown function (DUF3298)